MKTFDYGSAASLVFTGEWAGTSSSRGPIPFQLASNAIRYAIEELEPSSFDFMYLEASGRHYDDVGIRTLYDDTAYPLSRAAIPCKACRATARSR
ncbi:MAG: hypothetical protein JNJ53_03645 [Rhizobiales bacterium]|nr:hypothetical protein [Hyphomicrobiales bacterium]